jgi:hypothetical protein
VQITTLPAPYSQIVLAARQKDTLEDPPGELFNVSDWVQGNALLEDGGGGTVQVPCYIGRLDLSWLALSDYIGTELDREVWISIEMNDGGQYRETPLIRARAVVYRDLHRGNVVAPNPGPNPYPPSDQLAPKTGANFRIRALAGGGYVLELYNAGAASWHEVGVAGGVGEQALTLS